MQTEPTIVIEVQEQKNEAVQPELVYSQLAAASAGADALDITMPADVPAAAEDTSEAPAVDVSSQHSIHDENGYYVYNGTKNDTYNSLTKDGLWVGGVDDKTGFHVDNTGHASAYGLDVQKQKITGVADGTSDSDAATYGQVKDVDAKIGDLDFSDTHSLKKAENVTDALTKLDTKAYNLSGKIDDFSRSGIMAGGTLDSRNAGTNSIQLGNQARAAGQNSIAFGAGASVTGENTEESILTRAKNNGVAIGYSATAAGFNTTVLGAAAKAQGDNATALGQGTLVTADNSVALGAGSRVTTDDIRDSDTNGVVSVGKSDGERRIINVADGVNDSDAATVKQVKAVQGDVDELNKLAVTYDNTKKAVNFNGATLKNVGDIQIGNAQSTFVGSGLVNGKVYDTDAGQWAENGANATHSMAVGSKSSVRGKDSIAVGPEAAVNNGNAGVLEQSTAVGSNATVLSNFSTALGAHTQAKGDYSVAVGTQSQTTGANATAIGAYAAAGENSVVVGGGEGSAASAVSQSNGTAMGTYVDIKSDNGTALGYGSQIGGNGKNSVALGADSVANEENVVSVGHTKDQANGFGGTYGEDLNRRIINVADGTIAEDSHDAVTGGQLYTTNQNVADNADKLAAYEKSGIEAGAISGKTTSQNLAIGQNSKIAADGNVTHNVAIGNGATVEAGLDYTDPLKPQRADNVTYATAVGAEAKATGNGSTVYGAGSSTSSDYSTAIGRSAKAGQGAGDKATALGYNAQATDGDTLAAGANSKAWAAGSVALGADTTVNYGADNSVALGTGSKVFSSDIKDSDVNGVVSVGFAGGERRIINVADGVNATDAATVGQISKITGMDSEKGNVVQYDGEDKSVVTFAGENGTKLTNLAAGEFKADSTDAVTAGQLYAAGIVPGTISSDKYTTNGAIALGENALVSGERNGVDGSIAIGDEATVDNTTMAVALGSGSTVSAAHSIALGANSTATASFSTAVGPASTASGDSSTAVGYDSTASGMNSAAFGYGSEASGMRSTALGHNSSASGMNSVALGYNSTADEANVVSVGNDKIQRKVINVADGTIAANSHDAVTGGQLYNVQSSVTALDNLAVKYDTADKTSVTFNRDNKAGSVLNNVNDIVMQVETYNTSGKVSGYKSLSFKDAGLIPGSVKEEIEDSLSLGNGSSVTANAGVAVGVDAKVQGSNSVAIGQGAKATAVEAVAVGHSSDATDQYATALGDNSYADGVSSTAVGHNAFAYADNSTALGDGTTIALDAVGSVALGQGSKVVSADVLESETYGVVSVGASGDKGFTRRIINVADGTIAANSHDAVTGGQLYATNQSVEDNADKLAAYEASGVQAGTVADVNKMGSIALGEGSTVKGNYSLDEEKGYATAIGGQSVAGMNAATAVGGKSLADQAGAIAVGYNSQALENNAISIGLNSKTEKLSDIAIGPDSRAAGGYAVALGKGSEATGYSSVALGHNSVASGQNTVSVGNDDLKRRITNVADGLNDSDAATVGQLNAMQSAYTNSGIVGGSMDNNTLATGAVAIGKDSKVHGTGSVAIGTGSKVEQHNSVAIGRSAIVKGAGSVALGASSVATEDNVLSLGRNDGSLGLRIVNMKDGIKERDAVTVGQMNELAFGTRSGSRTLTNGATNLADGIDRNTTAIQSLNKQLDNAKVDWGESTQSMKELTEKASAFAAQTQNVDWNALNSVDWNAVNAMAAVPATMNLAVDDVQANEGDTGAEKDDDDRSPQTNGSNPGEVDGNLHVSGNTTLDGTLNVKGDATFEGNATFDKGATMKGDLNMSGNKITGLGAGDVSADSTDAVNGSQLFDVQQQVSDNRNAIGALGSRVSDLGEEVDSVGAISAALAGLHPLDYNGTGSKFQISAALGTYDGTQAAAIGGFYHFNRDTLLSIGGSTSFEGDRKTAANVGVTFRVGEGASEAPAVQDNETKQQMEAMKQEIEMLKAELEQLKNKDTEGTNDKN